MKDEKWLKTEQITILSFPAKMDLTENRIE